MPFSPESSGVPILDARTAARWAEDHRRAGRRLVFTSGVFDLLHPGHVRLLTAARAEGDVLIVGLSSDRAVRATKGPGRPITPEGERAEILSALACVDAAVIFDADTPAGIIRAVQPGVLVERAGGAGDATAGRDTVEARGGRVVQVPLEEGWSTSEIVRKMRAAGGS